MWLPLSLMLCGVQQCLAGNSPCTVDMLGLQPAVPNLSRMVGKWYQIKWGAYKSTKMTAWTDYMMHLAVNPTNPLVLDVTAGLRQYTEDKQCVVGTGNITSSLSVPQAPRMLFENKAAMLKVDVTFRLLDIDYDTYMSMLVCEGVEIGTRYCPENAVEFMIWSRNTTLDSAYVRSMLRKMKGMCIKDEWIHDLDAHPCDGLNAAGEATCPINLNLISHDEDASFAKLVGKWYQNEIGAEWTVAMPESAWADVMLTLVPSGINSMDVTANIRRGGQDTQCVEATGKLAPIQNMKGVYRMTFANPNEQISAAFVFRVMEVVYDDVLVMGICGETLAGYCDAKTNEVTVWSRTKKLSEDHHPAINKVYKMMCIDIGWVKSNREKPCDKDYEGTTTLAASSLMSHGLLILLLPILSTFV